MVVWDITTLGVIHESSPWVETMLSPASSITSSSGMVFPLTSACMAPPGPRTADGGSIATPPSWSRSVREARDGGAREDAGPRPFPDGPLEPIRSGRRRGRLAAAGRVPPSRPGYLEAPLVA